MSDEEKQNIYDDHGEGELQQNFDDLAIVGTQAPIHESLEDPAHQYNDEVKEEDHHEHQDAEDAHDH